MIGAHVVTETGRRFTAKQTTCQQCGAVVEYWAGKPKYCKPCADNVLRQLWVKRYRDKAPERQGIWAQNAALIETLKAKPKPGFCSKCGIIRLSVVNVSGVCDGCAND